MYLLFSKNKKLLYLIDPAHVHPHNTFEIDNSLFVEIEE